jgi:hypothetical protein
VICQGWVRVLGLDSISIRLAAVRGAVTDQELEDTDRPDLFSSFEEMMEANGWRCRRGTGGWQGDEPLADACDSFMHLEG